MIFNNVKKISIYFLLTVAVISPPQYAVGQTELNLTYHESIQFALRNSYEIINFRQDLERDILNLRGARAGLKSNARLELDFPAFDESLSQEFNSQGISSIDFLFIYKH